MAQNITLLGASYSDVPAVTLPKTGGGTARFDDCSVVTAEAADVRTGETFVASNGTVTSGSMPNGTATAPTTISGSQATLTTGTNTITLQKTLNATPRITTAGYISAGTAGSALVSLNANVTTRAAQTIYPSASDQSIASGTYTTGAQTIKGVTTSNILAANIKQGVVVTVGDSDDADRILSVTGTYSGGGGESKNAQVVQGTTRTTSSTLTAIGAELTVSKTGTYDVYWSGFRSSTSSSYTYGTQLFIDNVAYGTENTTWSNHVQNNHLQNVSLTANQKIRVRGRNSRGSSYYIYAPTLVIIEV